MIAEEIVPHYPEQCASCNQELEKRENKPDMGYYVLELQPQKSGFEVVCQLHHYHELKCECGHQTKARPGVGYISFVEGRSLDLKLTETDGYKAYRSHPKRQRCLAHLIRKAIAISGAINQKAAKIGKFILQELKGLISSIANGEEKSSSTVRLHLSL